METILDSLQESGPYVPQVWHELKGICCHVAHGSNLLNDFLSTEADRDLLGPPKKAMDKDTFSWRLRLTSTLRYQQANDQP